MNEFIEWMEDGNVAILGDNIYTTQDAQYRNRIKGVGSLFKYYVTEFKNQ